MRIKKDISGQRFGKLTAIEPTKQDKKRNTYWLCKHQNKQKTEVNKAPEVTRAERESMDYKTGFKLFDDTYLCVFDKCLVIVKVDKEGNIIRVSTFGEKKEA